MSLRTIAILSCQVLHGQMGISKAARPWAGVDGTLHALACAKAKQVVVLGLFRFCSATGVGGGVPRRGASSPSEGRSPGEMVALPKSFSGQRPNHSPIGRTVGPLGRKKTWVRRGLIQGRPAARVPRLRWANAWAFGPNTCPGVPEQKLREGCTSSNGRFDFFRAGHCMPSSPSARPAAPAAASIRAEGGKMGNPMPHFLLPHFHVQDLRSEI